MQQGEADAEKQGHRDEARTMLGDIYGSFTEGFDTAYLKGRKGATRRAEQLTVSDLAFARVALVRSGPKLKRRSLWHSMSISRK
jgi:hypothetical protein